MVQSFWNEIKNMMTNRNIGINLNFQTVSFGTSRNKKDKIIINFIMIAAKNVIVKCKYTQVNPEIIHYKNYLKILDP